MKKRKLVVVGNGMAGTRTLEELLELAPDLYDITVFGAEPYPNYNRILLSPVLTGEQTVQDIILNDLDWYREHGIDLRLESRIVDIRRQRKEVVAEDGSALRYDRLLLATGSNPVILPVPGHDLRGVVTFRDIRDVNLMIEAAGTLRRAIVIGGGLLGLEAANGLASRGMEVAVVHLGASLLDRQLDTQAAGLLRASLEQRGLEFLMERQTEAILGTEDGRVRGIRFADGEEKPADLIVMAVGIRPNTELAERAGIHTNRGIVVNDTLQTYDPSIYAVGECVSHRGTAYGLVAPLFEQAKVAANHLAFFGISRYPGSVTSTKLKVTGIDVFSAGDFVGGGDTEAITLADPMGGVYKKLVIRDDKLVGACLYGDTVDGGWYFRLIKEARSIDEMRDHLMYGEGSAGDTGHAGQNSVVGMPDSTEVCGCNGVCKGTIVKAIREKGLFTVDEIKKHTKAASSCGSCTGLVEQILINCVGGAANIKPRTEKPLCGCTDFTHGEVRKAIRDHHLASISQAMEFLEWRNSDGCATCRPALNYYVTCTWPGEARDDAQSRLANERMHANIQKDGTYSVVPRMWGGVTTPAELRRIADVAEKYEVPMVKVTGGQRIDLLGVRKQDLPAVWKDLDMPSGHAYGKGLRTVKTCVGSEFCRFGTQDSTAMGIALEKDLVGMSGPHKIKLAVSGCPRNCAESGIKDVGVIAVDSGWEIYVGGNGGIKTEVAQFFAKVASPAEVLEYAGAFLQLYREEAFYLERTCHYLGRVGLDHAKTRVVDDAANRAALYERLKFALSFERDPWSARVQEPAARREFEPLSA
ncbi:nitrite reductase large subunit NirB [Candidimonas humi]|uniref:Nitrite reductase large subunit NirB n=1 Tax=Candidimonas humi TaxID=683355 RepID=A0ABV8NUC6_9BURK|nr:nitrite reductase large subunit NirB [Candidimonas humi]MBV6307073.1 nitrite reductase large subunit NirB [Candidimonas humi]